MKTVEGVTESLKAADPMAWVQRMNSIRARAEEIVREELLFDAYVDFNGFDRETIRKDFHDLYAAMNGKTTQEIDEIIYSRW